MANSEFAADIRTAPGYAGAPTTNRLGLAAIAFTALLLLIFVGFDAFQPPVNVSAYGGVKEASQGDMLRQTSYLLVFGLVLLAAWQHRGFGAIRAIPLSVMALLGWCLASALWAAEPNVVFRRAGLEIVIVSSLFLGIDALGAERAFGIWRWLLAAVLLIGFVSVPLIPAARHLAGETSDAALVGNWRGLYGHKNIAGAVCAMTAIVFLFSKTGWRNCIGIAIAIAACIFLAMTRSKTSLGLLPPALVAGLLYRFGWRDSLSRAILVAVGLLLLVAAAGLAAIDAGAIAHALEDPQQFTGRAAIWAAELGYIRDHPLLGSGFGTFADTGGLSPLHNYVSGSWIGAASHGHNGYLQLCVTIGGIGFALALWALVVVPLKRFWALDESTFKPMLLALFTFLLLHNAMESDFLEGDGVTWAGLVLVLAALAQRAHHSLTGAL